jgi:ComF family protein
LNLKYWAGTLFPSQCHACGQELVFPRLEGARFPLLCERCNVQLRPLLGEERLSGLPLLAAFEAERTLTGLIKAWKYTGRDAVLPLLVSAMAERLRHSGWPRPWLLVPVPLPLFRRVKRGFNQSELLARGIARELGLEKPRCLLHRGLMSGQQASRRREERLSAAGREFRRRKEYRGDACLVLVDDLCTTGATLLACRDALDYEGPVKAVLAGRVSS